MLVPRRSLTLQRFDTRRGGARIGASGMHFGRAVCRMENVCGVLKLLEYLSHMTLYCQKFPACGGRRLKAGEAKSRDGSSRSRVRSLKKLAILGSFPDELLRCSVAAAGRTARRIRIQNCCSRREIAKISRLRRAAPHCRRGQALLACISLARCRRARVQHKTMLDNGGNL